MTRDRMQQVMVQVFTECQGLRDAGQKEYAHEETEAFSNFKRVGNWLGLSCEKTLLIYFLKHVDGIIAWVNGHRSQREDVRGRINDAIVYLCILRGMVDEAEGAENAH